MLLNKVIKNINQKFRNIKFKNIRFNSRECKQNDIFFAIKGSNLDGKKYIDDAINNGAKIIISNNRLEGFNKKKNFIYL